MFLNLAHAKTRHNLNMFRHTFIDILSIMIANI